MRGADRWTHRATAARNFHRRWRPTSVWWSTSGPNSTRSSTAAPARSPIARSSSKGSSSTSIRNTNRKKMWIESVYVLWKNVKNCEKCEKSVKKVKENVNWISLCLKIIIVIKQVYWILSYVIFSLDLIGLFDFLGCNDLFLNSGFDCGWSCSNVKRTNGSFDCGYHQWWTPSTIGEFHADIWPEIEFNPVHCVHLGEHSSGEEEEKEESQRDQTNCYGQSTGGCAHGRHCPVFHLSQNCSSHEFIASSTALYTFVSFSSFSSFSSSSSNSSSSTQTEAHGQTNAQGMLIIKSILGLIDLFYLSCKLNINSKFFFNS